MSGIQILPGILAVIAIMADLFSIYTFVNTVRIGQYSDIPRKVLTIILIFSFAVTMYYLSKGEYSFDSILYFFACLYLIFSFVSCFLTSTVLKGNKMSSFDYLMFTFASLLIYSLGILLLFILGKDAIAFSILFFICSIAQIFYLLGEYMLKQYLEAKNVEIPTKFMGEFPVTLREFIGEIKTLPRLFSNPISSDVRGVVEFKTVSYKHFALDCLYLMFCTILGLALLIINNPDGGFVIKLL